jgi:hypothetical protein
MTISTDTEPSGCAIEVVPPIPGPPSDSVSLSGAAAQPELPDAEDAPAEAGVSEDLEEEGEEEQEEGDNDFHEGAAELGVDQIPSACMYYNHKRCILREKNAVYSFSHPNPLTHPSFSYVGMSCGHTGMTRLLVHKVPYFRELIIASFYCDNCGERNNDVTFGGEIQVLTACEHVIHSAHSAPIPLLNGTILLHISTYLFCVS